MTIKQAQVYIATTQGLVQVQSVVPLNDPDLSSVMTINGSSQRCAISRDYTDFVQPPQGIICTQFGGSGYRANVSAQIDSGSSWHLGLFVAHYLAAAERDDTDDTDVQASHTHKDPIIICSGEINTQLFDVNSIHHLEQKCRLATQQIKSWQTQGKQVLFLVPAENYRQALPDCGVQLTPIANLSQIPSLLRLYGIHSAARYPFEQLDGLAQKSLAEKPLAEKLLSEQSILEKSFSSHAPDANYLTIEAEERPKSMRSRILTPSVFIASAIWLLIACIIYVGIKLSAVNSAPSLSALEYQFLAIVSENKASCVLANELAQLKQSNSPNVAVINGGDKRGISTLSNIVQLPALGLKDLCAMTLHTSSQIKALWLLSESGAIIDLRPIVSAAGNHEWSIPLPQNQSLDRRYHLLLFTEPRDASDQQSLQAHIKQLADNQQRPSLVNLSQWANRLSIPTIFIEHMLYSQ